MPTADDVERWLAAAAADDKTEDPHRKLLALGPEDLHLIEPLRRALEDRGSSLRIVAARTLGRMRAEACAAPLLRCMDEQDDGLRAHAAVALACRSRPLRPGGFGSRAARARRIFRAGAREVLVGALRTSDVAENYWAAEGLTDALPVLPVLVADVIAMLDHWNHAIVELGGYALSLRPLNEVIPLLLRALVGGSEGMKYGVLKALLATGSGAREAAHAIATAMFEAQVFESSGPRVPATAAMLVQTVPLDLPDVKAAVLLLLENGSSWARERAAHALLALGSAMEDERERARAELEL
jgi:HEAT repeat protein